MRPKRDYSNTWNVEDRVKVHDMIERLWKDIWTSSPGSTDSERADAAEEKLVETLISLGFEEHRGLTGSPKFRVEGRLIYNQTKENLWFCVARDRVMRASKEVAKKVLVLGLGC
jgi:hypothetical protein